MDKDLRRLALTAVAVLVFLFVGRTVLGSMFDDVAAKRSVGLVQRKLVRGGEAGSRPDRADMSAVTVLRDSLQERLAELVPKLEYQRPAEFSVPDGVSADLRYIEVLRREQEHLVQGARFIGKSVPRDLGMPVPNPTGMEDVRDALRALHIVERVVTAALDADVSSVDAIRIRPQARRSVRVAGLVRTHPVEFELTGAPAAIRTTLRRVVTGEPYLALDDVRIESEDEGGDVLSCKLTVAVLSFDRERLQELEILD